MESGSIRSYKRNKGYESIPRELLQSNDISLEAIGLLCHLQSYPETWKLYKTELYTRFKYNKRTSVQRIWKELIKNYYLLEFKKRDGKRYIYQYIYSVNPFSKEEIRNITEELLKDGFFWDVDFEQPKMDSSKSTPNRLTIEKINYKKDLTKKEGSQSSPSFLTDDDDNINTNNQIKKSTSEEFKETMRLLFEFLDKKTNLKPLARNLLFAGLKETDVLAIIQFLCTLPEINQEVSDLVNSQIRANEREAKTNGLTDYKAYFIKGLKLKLENANYKVDETDITDPELVAVIPKVTLHDWLNDN